MLVLVTFKVRTVSFVHLVSDLNTLGDTKVGVALLVTEVVSASSVLVVLLVLLMLLVGSMLG